MLDREKLPGDSYIELITLFGAKKAEEVADEVQYNYMAIQRIILDEKLKRSYHDSKLRWIVLKTKAQIILFAQKNRTIIIYACILATIVVTVYKILD